MGKMGRSLQFAPVESSSKTTVQAIFELGTKEVEMPIPAPVDVAFPYRSRRLVVSDNPETLDADTMPAETATLWHDAVRTRGGPVHYRVFGWHLNRTGRPLAIGLSIENGSASSPLVMNGVWRSVQFSSGDYLRAGAKLSTAFMAYQTGACMSAPPPSSGTGDHITGSMWPTQLFRGKNVIEAFRLEEDQLIGFLYEFTLWPADGRETDIVLRTVAAKMNNPDTMDRSPATARLLPPADSSLLHKLSRISSPPLPTSGTHPRGSWAFADIVGTTRVYHVGNAWSESISNGNTDRLLAASASYDPARAMNNFGHFGAVYFINVPVFNNIGADQIVQLLLNPRGGVYSGAANIYDRTYTIPTLRPSGVNTALAGNWRVRPGLSHIAFAVMHAGASFLPLAVHVSTINRRLKT